MPKKEKMPREVALLVETHPVVFQTALSTILLHPVFQIIADNLLRTIGTHMKTTKELVFPSTINSLFLIKFLYSKPATPVYNPNSRGMKLGGKKTQSNMALFDQLKTEEPYDSNVTQSPTSPQDNIVSQMSPITNMER
jgi:hypothetical protein